MSTLLDYTFFRNAIAGILILSIATAVIGTYIMTRRMVFISGGITHACFGGLGLGYYLGVNPVAMAAAFAVTSSLGVEWLSTRFRVREDSAIAVMWALGMAVGVLFVFLTPGYVPELNSFLFGNILTISTSDLWIFGLFTLLLLAFFATFYYRIIACAFDRDFARVSGLPVRFISYSMTVFVAVCIVLTIRLVGIMLLMSMLTMPQMIAETYCRRFRPMMITSVIIAAACSLSGLLLAAVIDVPCSAVIVILMVIVYFAARLTRALSISRRMQ